MGVFWHFVTAFPEAMQIMAGVQLWLPRLPRRGFDRMCETMRRADNETLCVTCFEVAAVVGSCKQQGMAPGCLIVVRSALTTA